MTSSYDWDSFVERIRRALAACKRLGGDASELVIEPAADEVDVLAVESKLKTKLPSAFRSTLLTFSRRVEVSWYLPQGAHPPFSGIFSGCLQWNLNAIIQLQEGREKWIRHCFPNPDDAYDSVWHNKLAFLSVPNGDMWGIGVGGQSQTVAYLSHDDGEGHGYELGADFNDCIDRLSRLGCPGSEDWQLMPFMSGPTDYLDPDCPNAKRWLDWFGM